MKKLISFIFIGCQTIAISFAQNATETATATTDQQNTTTETTNTKAFHDLRTGSFLQIGGGAGHGALNYNLPNGTQK